MSEIREVKPRKSQSTAIREHAARTGLLPHEWLLKVARGEPIEQSYVEYKRNPDPLGPDIEVITVKKVFPDVPMRIDAAKSCAAFFAPKLAAAVVHQPTASIADVLKDISAKLPN
jgi:hypothetical protein